MGSRDKSVGNLPAGFEVPEAAIEPPIQVAPRNEPASGAPVRDPTETGARCIQHPDAIIAEPGKHQGTKQQSVREEG
jgi:hypothetical protein